MLFQQEGVRVFNGRSDYTDLSDELHHFLRGEAFSADIAFSTQDPGYQTLFGIYYKETILPNFAIALHKGRAALVVKRSGGLRVYVGGEACCDGQLHQISFRGCSSGLRLWLDGQQVIEDKEPGPWCCFGYVGFATIGRGTRADQYEYFSGEMHAIRLSAGQEPLPAWGPQQELLRTDLFFRGLAGVENFRIPMLITAGETVIASADARMDAPGDNPNHICRAVRLSRDSGETWSEPKLMCDFGGAGRKDGAAAIDGSLLYDKDTRVLWMLYSHTSAGIGSAASRPGTGFDPQGRRCLTGRDGRPYYLSDGAVIGEHGEPAGFTCGAFGRLFRDGEPAGSICHGEDRLFRQADTSFLQLICSTDGGETWSEPVELNPQVKQPWMKFIGAGPGTGIQLQEGPHRGRLVYPVYVSNEAGVCSSGAIFSDDHGRTWHPGGLVNDFREAPGGARGASDRMAMDLGECQITELPGGQLRIFLRNLLPERRTCTADSSDGGGELAQLHPPPGAA